MPAEIHDAKIALMKYPLELKDVNNAKVDLTNPLELQAFLDNEEEMLKDIANQIISTEYFSLNGQRLSAPFRGICICKLHYNNGTTIVKKIMKR